MKRSHRCPKCQSTDIITGVQPLDLGHGNAAHTAQLATYRSPEAFLFKGRQSTGMKAWVCAECGFVEMHAEDPDALRTAAG